MGDIVIHSRINPRHGVPEKNNGPVLVDRAGYVSGEKRINALMVAGLNLVQSRREEFDSWDGSEPEIDPTRNPGFDMADAHKLAMSTAGRLNSQRAAKKAADEEAKKIALESKEGTKAASEGDK